MFTQLQMTATPLGTTVDIDGMDFVQTDIPSSENPSQNLLVASTLLTQGQAAHAAQRLQALRKSDCPITHGQIVMHARTGNADVTAWGHKNNATENLRYPLRLAGQDLSWGENKDSTLKMGFTGTLIPSALLTVEPGFENHPAAVNWLTSVALAAAKTEADAHFIVRLIREDEYNALLRYVYGDMSTEEIKAIALLQNREGPPRRFSVVDSEADKRTRRGITDAFGHMLNWLETLLDPTKLIQEDSRFLELNRVLRGASWRTPPRYTNVFGRYGQVPDKIIDSQNGVRLVAVSRAPEK